MRSIDFRIERHGRWAAGPWGWRGLPGRGAPCWLGWSFLARPQVADQFGDRSQCAGSDGIEASLPVTGFLDQPGLFENRQVFGDCRAALGETGGDDPGGHLTTAEEGEDLPASGIGQGVECVRHSKFRISYVTISELNTAVLEAFPVAWPICEAAFVKPPVQGI